MTTATTAAATTATTRRCSLISDAYKKCRLHAQEPCSQIAFADGRNPFPEKEKPPPKSPNACFLLIAIAIANIHNSTHIHNQSHRRLPI